MADNYLEKRYDECFGSAKPKVKRVGHPLDDLLLRNRSCRGYNKNFVVTRDMLERIVGVNAKIGSACNQQVLRFFLVTRDTGASKVLEHIRLGAALPEMHLPLPGTEPEAFIIVCSSAPESRLVDVDLGISVQSMLLKATEMGLAGICIGAFNKVRIAEAFSLPFEPLMIVAIGKSAEQFQLVPIAADEPHAYYRKDNVHYIPKVRLDNLLLN